MKKEVFNLNKNNIYEDRDNYYFFRALEPGDFIDVDNNITTNSNGEVIRIRTDRERHGGDTKYNSASVVSLEEVTDHIKMHYLPETNCISLTSNANTVLTYGRGNERERYVVVKVAKDRFGKKIFQAGPYMLEEIEKKLSSLLKTYDDTTREAYEKTFSRIDSASTLEELDAIKKVFIDNGTINIEEEKDSNTTFVNGLDFNVTNSGNYNALDDDANLEKNKIVLKLDLIKEQILPRISNRFLIQTVGSAFSSAELIHYDDILRDELIDVSSELIDVFALLQQVPKTFSYVDEVKDKLLYAINNFGFSGHINYGDYDLSSSKLSIDNMYEVFDNGKVSYHDAKELYRKAYYLAKSRLRAVKSVELLDTILEGNPKYSSILNYIKMNGYGIEPEITTRVSKDLITVSESVSLDVNRSDIKLVNYISSLGENDLISILNNPNMAIKSFYLNHFLDGFRRHEVSRAEYIADSLIDSLDLRSYGVRLNLSNGQRRDIREKLMEVNLEEVYDFYRNNKVLEKDIARIIFTNLIKGTRDINTKEKFTLEELEWFIGYNKVKDTELKLLSYQRPIIGRVKEKYKSKQFTSVVMPTGTGKTYISLAMMDDFEKLKKSLDKDSHAKILYLAPNNEILDQLKETIRKVYHPEEHIGEDIDAVVRKVFPNLVATTYQNLKDYSSVETGPDGKKELKLKDKFNQQFDFIVLDELHRTGANEWYSVVGALLDSQSEETKILGASATPERDVDFKDMTDFWARKYNYSEEEILLGEQMAFNMSLIDAIKLGYVVEPQVITCEYSLVSDGTLDELKLTIDELLDENVKKKELSKYETLRRNVESSDGIEKILRENINDGDKFIVFLPVTQQEDGTYRDDNFEEVEDSRAEQIVKDYQALFMQYLYADKYFTENKNIYNLYLKIVSGVELDSRDKEYLESEKSNLLLLSKINVSYKPSVLNTKLEEMASIIINEMSWKPLEKSELVKGLTEKIGSDVECYSMLGEYSNSRNRKELDGFRNSKSDKKKLMFVINKANEGIHIGDVNGIVWLRPMNYNSRILYQQQLGRCIEANIPGQTRKNPVVLDLVNNTLKVKLQRGETEEERDLNSLKNLVEWIEVKGYVPDSNSENEEEKGLAKTLRRLQQRYIKYFDEERLNEEKNTESIVVIRDILRRGSDIGLWDIPVEDEEWEVKNESRNYSNTNDSIYGNLHLNAISKGFLELVGEVEYYEASEFDKKVQENYGYLKLLFDSGQSTRLTASDRVYIYEEDGKEHARVIKHPKTNKNGGPALSKGETKEEYEKRKRLYDSKEAKPVGDWFYRHYEELSEEQQRMLIDIGYIGVQNKNDKFNSTFENNYDYLKLLFDSGQSTNLAKTDKVYIYEEEDGKKHARVIKYPKTNKDGGPALSKDETKEEYEKRKRLYDSEKAKPVGYWFYRHYEELSEEQQRQLIEIGYTGGQERLANDEDKPNSDFEENYYYLTLLKADDQSTDLSSQDKVYIYEDKYGNEHARVIKKPATNKNGGPALSKGETKEEYERRKQEYEKAKTVGRWFYMHYEELSEEQQRQLIEIGYTGGQKRLANDEDKLNSDFKENYEYLKLLHDDGLSTDLSSRDKVYIYEEDGKRHARVIKKPATNRKNGGPALSKGETKEEYERRKQEYEKAKTVGRWFYMHYEELSEEQQRQLIEIGYTGGQKRLANDEDKLNSDFKENYEYLKLLHDDGLSTDLTASDKVYIYEEDGKRHARVIKYPKTNKDGGPSLSKGETKEEYEKRKQLYYSEEAISVGKWFYNNYDELSEEQQKRLIDIGYTGGQERLANDEDKLDSDFEENYYYLTLLKADDQSTDLSSQDKVYIYEEEDGTEHARVIKYPKTNKDGGPSLSKGETKEEYEKRKQLYYSEEAKTVGDWFYRHYEELSEEQQRQLIKIGYTGGQERLAKKKNYEAAKNNFDEGSTYNAVCEKLVVNNMSDGNTNTMNNNTDSSGKRRP